ncbi:phosphoserine phosphatase SerB [Schaalia sp. 19OD2882]|uniref:phosphoserine phosphatase SerB n=1 Tax=Schaalia sp. 19OD2882 TaxID=2794089 RepID=UPI001C1F1374|nr:phosphoserine phosphatase SerB [Schaalia sp. 19OD2882]QWW20650.1 phosphoserine phosphatase SerB [Schaalia sp. 19OD2882]
MPADLEGGPALVVTDVDSTLIQEEVIEELAEHAGTRAEVAALTVRAMNGELDFAQSLRRRVATLAGVPSTVFTEVLEQIRPSPGAQRLVDLVHSLGGHFGVVSGGFEEVVAPLCERMGIDHHVANRLEVAGGVLTGRLLGEIVTSDTKVAKLREWAAMHGVGPERVIAVGDGANDVPMLHSAGLGVAFMAKPAVSAQVPFRLAVQRLDAVSAAWL